MKKKSVFANQTMRIGLLMLLDALLISASLLMGAKFKESRVQRPTGNEMALR